MKNTVLTLFGMAGGAVAALFGGWDAALENRVGWISLGRAMKTN